MTEDIATFRTAFSQQVVELDALMGRIPDSQIACALEFILSCEGTLLAIGLGKSGIIARKIAATFASIGMKAAYIHATDALHGDIGTSRKGDIAILISNSGETQEVLDVLASLRSRGVRTIALTGNKDSRLGCGTDCVLEAKVSAEACRLNLAPTTSTTAALVVADSLAVAVMTRQKLSPEDFALSHPAGRLGRRLTLRVADVMPRGSDKVTIHTDARWQQVIAGIVDGQLGAVSVVDSEGRLVGIITDGDIRRALARLSWRELEEASASALMTRNPVSTAVGSSAASAFALMTGGTRSINVLCVLGADGRSAGLVRLTDITRAGI